MRISQHKIWRLDPKVAAAAKAALRPPGATWDAKPATDAGVVASVRSGESAAASPRMTSRDAPSRLDLYGEGRGPAAPPTGGAAAIALRADRRQRVQVLMDGLVVLRGALDLGVQQRLLDLVREIGVSSRGFYTPKTRGGSMHLQMMCLGRHWDSLTQRYERTRTNVDGEAVAPMPVDLWELVRAAAETATEACESIPAIEPGVCLVNHYTHGGRLGMHQDKSESADSLRRGAPVISISIGDACDFGFSTTRPEETDASAMALGGSNRGRSIRLDSGDVLIFGGGCLDLNPAA